MDQGVYLILMGVWVRGYLQDTGHLTSDYVTKETSLPTIINCLCIFREGEGSVAPP